MVLETKKDTCFSVSQMLKVGPLVDIRCDETHLLPMKKQSLSI